MRQAKRRAGNFWRKITLVIPREAQPCAVRGKCKWKKLFAGTEIAYPALEGDRRNSEFHTLIPVR
jgi:hypothetical protein